MRHHIVEESNDEMYRDRSYSGGLMINSGQINVQSMICPIDISRIHSSTLVRLK